MSRPATKTMAKTARYSKGEITMAPKTEGHQQNNSANGATIVISLRIVICDCDFLRSTVLTA